MQSKLVATEFLVEMNVSLSFTRVRIGTLANVRGLQLIKVLFIYSIIE